MKLECLAGGFKVSTVTAEYLQVLVFSAETKPQYYNTKTTDNSDSQSKAYHWDR